MASSSIDVAPDVVNQTTPASVRPVGVQTLNSIDYQEMVSGIGVVPCDYIALTYVASGNGAGEIETVTYKVGGASGTTIATLTLAYDANDKLSTVTRT
jgi:hypothetical protein